MSHPVHPTAGAAVSSMESADALRVVLAGGSPADRQWVSELLRSASSWTCEFLEADSGEAVLRQVQATTRAAERILLAGSLADMDALRLLALLAGPQGITPCPVVVITPGNGRELGPLLLRAGAQDYIGEDWLSPYVLARAVDNARVRWAMERDLCERDLALQRSEACAREADLRKDEFLATLAHELRNPLAPIRNGLEILRRSGQLTGPAQGARDMMERQLGHMVRLVDDLLDVSRISRGKVDLRLARITLQSVLDHALESSRPTIEASGHRLMLHSPRESLWVEGDLTRLAQVVSNLLNNAAKYTPAGGCIEVRALAQDDQAMIEVADNGTGICADMLPRVFDLFAQVDRTRERAQGGLGIGLSLVKKLVELHGGDIRAHSEGPSRGSRFTVRLPRAAAPVSRSVREAGAAPYAPPAAPRRVLVCDDNVDGAESLALMLGLLGHEVRTVHDGPQALAAVAHWCPDVALLDIGLPGLSGYELAQRLRADPALAGLVLVAVTGWGTEGDKRRSAQAGFDYHLTKPVEANALEAVLARHARPSVRPD